jgi:hypothetical protein
VLEKELTVGAVKSILTVNIVDAEDELPAASVEIAVTDLVPADKLVVVHENVPLVAMQVPPLETEST